MTRLGDQIPNFTYPDTGPGGLFDLVVPAAEGGRHIGLRQRNACVAPTHEQAVAEVDDLFGRRGLDGFTGNAVANEHIPGRVSLLGETVAEVVA